MRRRLANWVERLGWWFNDHVSARLFAWSDRLSGIEPAPFHIEFGEELQALNHSTRLAGEPLRFYDPGKDV